MTARDTPNSLRDRATKGVVALGMKSFGKYGVALVRMAVLGRLLTPREFGLFAMAMALMHGLATLKSLGPDKYVVQKKTVDPTFIGTAWSMRALLYVVIAVAALVSAPLYASAMGEAEAAAVIAIVAFASVANGLKSAGVLMAERSLTFGRLAVYEFVVAVIEAAVVIALAFWLRSATALAWALVTAAAVETVLSYVLFRFPFRPSFDPQALKSVFGVGKHFLVIALGTFAMSQGDNLIVGGTLGAALLGYYAIAYKLCDLPVAFTFQITNRVALSLYSRVQDDVARKARAFIAASDLQLLVLLPMVVGTFALADVLIPVLYGDRWSASIPVVRALGLVMLGRGLSHMVAPFLIANSHYQFAARMKILEVGVFFTGVALGVRVGLVGAALGAGAGYMTAAAVRLYYVMVKESIPLRGLLGAAGSSVAISAVALGVLLTVRSVLKGPEWASLILGGGSFVLTYALLSWAGRPQLRDRLRSLVGARRHSSGARPRRGRASADGG